MAIAGEENMNTVVHTLSPAAQFILTRRVPCAMLAVSMFTAVLWIPLAAQGLPLLTGLLSIFALSLQVLTPALFALILFGGGIIFAGQVAVVASIMAGLLAGMSILIGLLMFTLYALLPILSARALIKSGGLERSARHLAFGLGIAVLAALGFGAFEQEVSLQAFTGQLLRPFFDAFVQQRPAGIDGTAYIEMISQLRQTVTHIFPGFAAFSLWITWWSNVILARYLAMRYGFYNGHQLPVVFVRFGKPMAYGFSVALAMAGLLQGSLQYIAANTAIMLAGILAVQGLSVAHLWLRARNMRLIMALMYIFLLMQPAMVLPFVIIGILDIWFDYRRVNTPVAGGDKCN